MSGQAAPGVGKDRPESRRRPGNPFPPGNPGKPKGARDRRTEVGIEVARALASRARDTIEKLLDSRSPRVRFEAARLILSYAWGTPRQTLELVGGAGELARELTAALQEARARRAALAAPAPAAAVLAPPDAIEAEIVTEAAPAAPAPKPEEFWW